MSKVVEIQRYSVEEPYLCDLNDGVASDSCSYVGLSELSVDNLPEEFLREDILSFPQLSEFEVVRHYTKLSKMNFSIDEGFYPLGSCTMKYNPRVNEVVAGLEGFRGAHPLAPDHLVQGILQVMFELQEALKAITGLAGVSLHPAAGAHGELVGVKMIAAYHASRGDHSRQYILVPDSAHGTNPSSATFAGLKVKAVASDSSGIIRASQIEKLMNDNVAGMMITLPNTLGIFEPEILEISKCIHDRGGLLYCDGANLNALVGMVDFSALQVDVMHINLHKTFSTPHGGGGPGAGPVVVSNRLVDFLPVPVVVKGVGGFELFESIPMTIGKVRSFHGNVGMLVRALCYIYAFGSEQLSTISQNAVLKANYLREKLKPYYHLPFERDVLHEVVFSDRIQQKQNGVTAMDIAKRLMDFGFHPPTVYFPLIVAGALMIEPTETEPKSSLDLFIEAMIQIAGECRQSPEKVKQAPHRAGVSRFDETQAARNPLLTWQMSKKEHCG